jgi:hypothetical protein
MVIKQAQLLENIFRGKRPMVETTETGMCQFSAKTVVCMD